MEGVTDRRGRGGRVEELAINEDATEIKEVILYSHGSIGSPIQGQM